MKRLICILFISFGLALIDKNLQSKSDEQVGSRVEDTNGTDAIFSLDMSNNSTMILTEEDFKKLNITIYNEIDDENSTATTYIVPTEVISTTTQTNVNSKYGCPDYIWFVIASEEVTYISRHGYVYKIQNQRVVKKVKEADFFVQSNFSSDNIKTGYIRNGSLILLDQYEQVYIFDPIPMQSDKFKLREGFPKKTPLDQFIRGAIMINDKAYIFYQNEYLIYDERFNNVTTWMDRKSNFPNFPNDYPSFFIGGHTTSSNDQKFLTLCTTIVYTTPINGYPHVYTYDLERKNLVGGGKNLTEYLLNCD